MTGIDLADALSAPLPPAKVSRPTATVPNANTPGAFTWDGAEGRIITPALADRPTTWDAFIRSSGLNPDDVEVIEPVRTWGQLDSADRPGYTCYWLNLRRRRPGPGIDDLVALVGRRKRGPRPADTTTTDLPTFAVDLGDLQLGKIDGDGVAGTVQRVTDGLDRAAAVLRGHRRAGLKIGAVKLAWLGDCVEGFVSQGGANAWRTVLTQTEQIRLLRRLMLYGVDTFAPLTDTLIQLAVPGNHDQAVRLGGKGVTRYDDSFDVDALAAVSEALRLNPGSYSHVVTHTPAPDEATVTLRTAGTIVAHAHGHHWPAGKAMQWWEGQSFGDQLAGQADVLMSGHLHHFKVEQSGRRTWVQVPAMESESTWWRHRKGVPGAPGLLTSVLTDGKITRLHIV